MKRIFLLVALLGLTAGCLFSATHNSPPPPPIPVAVRGDINGDGFVNITDVVMLQGIIKKNDMNGDGKLDSADVQIVLNIAVGL